MALFPKPPIERIGTSFRVNLDVEERDLVHRLMVEFRALIEQADASDSRLVRLFPPAYHQDADRELDTEYQRLMREELLASR
ncbi:MAG TPA: hypothetical protein VGM78_04015, partial [Ilumatobacteraceae bacterium]